MIDARALDNWFSGPSDCDREEDDQENEGRSKWSWSDIMDGENTGHDGRAWGGSYEAPEVIYFDGAVVEREAESGGEGMGDQYWVVIKITESDGTVSYFQKDGWYASYSGGELDGDCYQVEPREVSKVEYFPVAK